METKEPVCLPASENEQRAWNSPSREPLPLDLLIELWVTMIDIFGNGWVSQWGDDPDSPTGAVWAKGLAGMRAEDIRTGVSACVTAGGKWPPTLPEFRARCLRIPSFAEFKLDVDKAMPFSRLVWQYLDAYAYRQASADRAERMLREAHEVASQHRMLGYTLPAEPAGLLTVPAGPVPSNPEHARRCIEELRKLLGLD